MRIIVGALLATAVVGCGSSTSDSAKPADFVPSEIAVSYSWIGLGPSRGYEYSGPCTSERCDLKVTCRDSANDSPGGGTVTFELPRMSVDARLVADFVATFDDPEPIATATEVIEHTDDYPHLEVGLTNADGATATFSTSSNTPDRTPWNIDFDGRLYASDTSASADAYSALLAAVGADTCWT